MAGFIYSSSQTGKDSNIAVIGSITIRLLARKKCLRMDEVFSLDLRQPKPGPKRSRHPLSRLHSTIKPQPYRPTQVRKSERSQPKTLDHERLLLCRPSLRRRRHALATKANNTIREPINPSAASFLGDIHSSLSYPDDHRVRGGESRPQVLHGKLEHQRGRTRGCYEHERVRTRSTGAV